MPNKDLQKTYHYCPVLDKKISYENMKKIKSFFDNYNDDDGDDTQYKNYGGEEMKQWLNNTLNDMRGSVYYPKKSKMDAGGKNQFKKTHYKDNDNTNITNVNLPKIAKSSNHRAIMANKTVYESIGEELNVMKYLIEYMNNNNNDNKTI